MKDLNEYKAEIFRRSDEKKRQIRKRRSIAAAVAVPLCLCGVVTAVLFPGATMSKGDAFAPGMNAICDAEQQENLEMSVKAVSFTARVVECGDGWVLVEPLEGELERNSCDKISFGTEDLEKIDVQVGTLVEITYNGMMMETYPAQIHVLQWKLAEP